MERRTDVCDRRSQSLQSVVIGGWRGRRAANRRDGDDQHFIVDVYDMGLIMVSLAVVIMSCLDAFFTLQLLSMGASEINFFMDTLIKTDQRVFLIVKLFCTCTGVMFLTMMSRYRLFGVLPVRRVLEGLCGIYVCLIIWELYLLVGVATTLNA